MDKVEPKKGAKAFGISMATVRAIEALDLEEFLSPRELAARGASKMNSRSLAHAARKGCAEVKLLERPDPIALSKGRKAEMVLTKCYRATASGKKLAAKARAEMEAPPKQLPPPERRRGRAPDVGSSRPHLDFRCRKG